MDSCVVMRELARLRILILQRLFHDVASFLTFSATSRELRVRIINLDGGLVLQPQLLKLGPEIIDMVEWGPSMRMECYWYTFNGFVDQLTERIGMQIGFTSANSY